MGLSRPRPAPAVWNRCFASTQPRWTADVHHRVPGQGRGLAGVGHQPRRVALGAAEAGDDALEPLRALADRTHRDLGLRHRADQPLVERVVIEQPAHRGLALRQAGDKRLRLGQHSPRPPLHAIRHRRGLPVVGYVKTYPPPHAPPGALGQCARALTAGERSGLTMGDALYGCYLRVGDPGPWAGSPASSPPRWRPRPATIPAVARSRKQSTCFRNLRPAPRRISADSRRI